MNAEPRGISRLTAAGSSRWRSLIGFVVGACLLAAAAWVVRAQGGSITSTWEHIRGQHAGWIALAFVLPLGNWLAMSACFWVLMRDEAAVAQAEGRAISPLGPGEMTSLVGTAWLLNYLPMRPGLFGRMAYHRGINGIPIRSSVAAVLKNLTAGAMAIAVNAAVIACIVLGLGTSGGPSMDRWPWLAGLVVPGALFVIIARCVGRGGGRGPMTGWWLACAVRHVDLLVWAARYLVVFKLVGESISLPGAMAAAVASQAASVIPFSGNGLGLREWAVGLMVAVLPASLAMGGENAGHAMTQADGITADLVNRVLEILAAVPVGLVCAALVARRVRAARSRGVGLDGLSGIRVDS